MRVGSDTFGNPFIQKVLQNKQSYSIEVGSPNMTWGKKKPEIDGNTKTCSKSSYFLVKNETEKQKLMQILNLY